MEKSIKLILILVIKLLVFSGRAYPQSFSESDIKKLANQVNEQIKGVNLDVTPHSTLIGGIEEITFTDLPYFVDSDDIKTSIATNLIVENLDNVKKGNVVSFRYWEEKLAVNKIGLVFKNILDANYTFNIYEYNGLYNQIDIDALGADTSNFTLLTDSEFDAAVAEEGAVTVVGIVVDLSRTEHPGVVGFGDLEQSLVAFVGVFGAVVVVIIVIITGQVIVVMIVGGANFEVLIERVAGADVDIERRHAGLFMLRQLNRETVVDNTDHVVLLEEGEQRLGPAPAWFVVSVGGDPAVRELSHGCVVVVQGDTDVVHVVLAAHPPCRFAGGLNGW
jgi:hypothetical protein